MTSYLRNYVDSVSELPTELQRCFTLMRELDQKALTLQTSVDKHCSTQLRAAAEELQKGEGGEPAAKRQRQSPAAAETKIWDEKTEQDMKQVLHYCDEKVQLAQQVYDHIDHQIRSLDKDLKVFDSELSRDRLKLGLGEGETAAGVLAEAGDKRYSRKATGGIQKPSRKQKGMDGSAAGSGLPPLPAGAADAPTDPTEPVYCYCKKVSFGEMIACDNPDCAIEWFHFQCVGLDAQPKGTWYCNECAALKRAGKLP